jgi:hypothetical protein
VINIYIYITKYCSNNKGRRLEWAGYLVGMSDDSTVKNAFMGTPDGRRRSGRPKLRWLDCIKYDLKPIGVKRG